MSINGIIGEQADYGELTVAIFNEGEGASGSHHGWQCFVECAIT
jgi:hypothetical protein